MLSPSTQDGTNAFFRKNQKSETHNSHFSDAKYSPSRLTGAIQDYKNKSLQYFFNPRVIRESLANPLTAHPNTFEQDSSLFEYPSHSQSPSHHLLEVPSKYRVSKMDAGEESPVARRRSSHLPSVLKFKSLSMKKQLRKNYANVKLNVASDSTNFYGVPENSVGMEFKIKPNMMDRNKMSLATKTETSREMPGTGHCVPAAPDQESASQVDLNLLQKTGTSFLEDDTVLKPE